MQYKKFAKIFLFIVLFLTIIFLLYLKFFKNKKFEEVQNQNSGKIYNSNIIKDVEYSTKDKDGNEYLIKAKEGEIDFSNTNVIFLKKVNSLITLTDSEEVTIYSDFGKYNSENYDTIFSKNVVIRYLDNKITGEYLDFSLERNSMIISKNVVYNNLENTLNADVIEINIKTKDTKIFMHEQESKVNVKSKD
ncbi:LPS export ABC transporter periplasmic protein LptC [Candidatus Pelagibacter sp. HIMB1495]|uniref:LPS export ABC transporter periplasmic protein LptC n=1 Tax=unclassified Candidatus Pelagibacter TaxID=2647897 RepID=UPI003F85CE92